MSEHPGFDLNQTHGRSIVRLRVRPQGADAAGEALQLPLEALHWRAGDPAAHWLGPDQWLLTSDTQSAEDILSNIDRTLSSQIYAATDMSSGYVCFALNGSAARTILAMGCGIDLHSSAFATGQCVRTHFANVMLFVVAVGDDSFDLYVSRSHARYLSEWLKHSSEDPITIDSNNSNIAN